MMFTLLFFRNWNLKTTCFSLSLFIAFLFSFSVHEDNLAASNFDFIFFIFTVFKELYIMFQIFNVKELCTIPFQYFFSNLWFCQNKNKNPKRMLVFHYQQYFHHHRYNLKELDKYTKQVREKKMIFITFYKIKNLTLYDFTRRIFKPFQDHSQFTVVFKNTSTRDGYGGLHFHGLLRPSFIHVYSVL